VVVFSWGLSNKVGVDQRDERATIRSGEFLDGRGLFPPTRATMSLVPEKTPLGSRRPHC
jgi:hypothetical protein